MGSEMTVERFAQTRADIDAGSRRDEALARAGITPDEWVEAQRVWLERMGDEIARGRFELSNRYAQVFLERQRARAAKPVAVQEAATGAGVSAPPLPVQAPRVEVAAASAELDPWETMPIPEPMETSMEPAMPFLPAGPEAPPVTPGPPLASAAFAELVPRETIPIPEPMESSLGPALPFSPAAPGASLPKVHRAPAALAGTSMALVVPKGPALPFSPAAPEAAPAAPGPALPKVHQAPAALTGTSMALVVPKGPALPFSPAAVPVAASVPSEAAAKPATQHGAEPGALSLERYASLCVEMAAEPANTGAILGRYGLTMEQGRAVDAYWKGRVAADPATRAAFDRAYSAYQAWFVTARQGPAKRA